MSAGYVSRLLRPGLALVIISLASIIGICVGSATRSVMDDPTTEEILPNLQLNVGDRFPEISLVDTAGAVLTSSAAIGSDGALVLFAYFDCPPCTAMARPLQALLDQGALPGSQILLISPIVSVPHLPAFHSRYGWTFPVYADTAALAMRRYGIEGFPLLVAVGSDLIIRGLRTDARLPIDSAQIASWLD